MQVFSIKDIENLTGIKAHTIRIWEQRYGLLNPLRSEGSHRLYGNEDLKKILAISLLYHNGHKISALSLMHPEEIRAQTLLLARQGNADSHINQLMEASIDLEAERFTEIIDTHTKLSGLESTFHQVLLPYLEKIGLLWLTGNILPAQEHFASHLIRTWIVLGIDKLTVPVNPLKPHYLLFTPSGEFHELPLLMVSYFLKKSACRVTYAGVNVSIETLSVMIKTLAPDRVYVHLLTNFTSRPVDLYLSNLCKAVGPIMVFASGAAVLKTSTTANNLYIVRSWDDALLSQEMHQDDTRGRT